MSEDKIEIVSSGTPQKDHGPIAQSAAAPARAQTATTAAAPAAQTIAPAKRQFRWYTPFGVARDFVKGTGLGFGDGLSKGARRGLKLGLVVAAVAFFLPLFPPAAALLADVAPAMVIGTNASGVAMFIPNGLEAIVAGLGYGLAGAVAGAVALGAVGLAVGGAEELKLRGRREKYAEELAERGEMRQRQNARAKTGSWHDYNKAYQRYDTMRQLRWFELEHDRLPKQQGGWAERENERAGMGYERNR